MSDDASVLEVMLLRWGESPTGRTVTLLLPDDPGSQHPFKGLRTGASNGQRLAISVALINDHEEQQPLEQPSQAPQKATDGPKPNGGNGHRLSNQAHWCCQDARFQRFLDEEMGFVIRADNGYEDAKRAVYELCDVDSRTEFDSDPEKAGAWRTLHGRFIAWREAP